MTPHPALTHPAASFTLATLLAYTAHTSHPALFTTGLVVFGTWIWHTTPTPETA